MRWGAPGFGYQTKHHTVKVQKEERESQMQEWVPLWVQFTNSCAHNTWRHSLGPWCVLGLTFLKPHTPASWGRLIFPVSKREWKLCWWPFWQLENGSYHPFILEARSPLPLGAIIRRSHFTPDTFRLLTSCGTTREPHVVPLARKHFPQATG